MKRTFTFLMSLFLMVGTMWAQTVDVDMTNKVGTSKDAWNGNNGGPITIDGISMPEKYEGTTETLGDVMWQTVTDLENGIYIVELWANARYTPGRMYATAFDGEENCTFLFANNVEKSIPVIHNENLNNNTSHRLVGVEVTDGTLKMGMTKKAAGSNWHSIQIKSLTYTTIEAVLAEVKKELRAVIDAATAVPATEELTAAIATAQGILGASANVNELIDAAATLNAATTLAVNTNAVAGATIASPVVTDFVVNGTFDTKTAPWKTTTKAVNQKIAENQGGAFTKPFFENWNASNYTGKIYQVIENIPNGLYELSICAFVGTHDASAQYIYANDDKKALITGAPTAYTVRTIVTDNKIEIGFEQTAAVNGWSGIDNVSLKFFGLVGEDYALEIYKSTKAAAEALATKKMSPEALAALNEALTTEVDETDDEALLAAEVALQEVMTTAQASVDFFASNKTAIDAMFALMQSTNVYTVEAYEAYSAKAEDYLAQYEAGTLTATVDNPVTIHGWHADVDYDEFLFSAFGTHNIDDAFHINTWSTEGESDGSEFKVPFFEYWTGDDGTLGVATKTATVTGLTPGQVYRVEAWVRVCAKNGVDAAEATGITLTVGDGEAVDITNGAVVPNTQFSHEVYTAYGKADAEGVLTINFNVLEGNNISWLSFKNLKYAEAVAATDEQKQALADAIAKAEGHTLGFAEGEYAPYTNVEALKALAAIKAIDLSGAVALATVEAAQATLEAIVWTANTEEMNAIYDGSFEYDYSAIEGDVKPLGWNRTSGTNTGYEVRYITNVPEGATSSNKGMFIKFTANYGRDAGYTMPLKAKSAYALSFVYTGWGNQPTVGIVIEDEAGNAVEITPASIIATADGQQDAANWQTYKGVFTTGDADANYILYFEKSETNQLQIAFGDFRLYTVVEVATVTLNKETIELKKGATEQLVAAVAPADATFQELAWVSDDEAVATVDDNGLVTAVAAGSATITATSVNGVKAECTVVVSDVDTDIQTITTNTETVIYDLAGRRVEKAVKGIYIVNGKKVIK